MKLTLVERMAKKDAPASWISEVRKMQRTIKSLEEDKSHYGGVIHTLATENQELRELFIYFFGEDYESLKEDER